MAEANVLLNIIFCGGFTDITENSRAICNGFFAFPGFEPATRAYCRCNRGDRGGVPAASVLWPFGPRPGGRLSYSLHFHPLGTSSSTLVQNSEDIIECLARPIKAGVPASAEWDGPAPLPGSEAEIADCRKVILEGLGTEPTDIDDLVRWCDAPTACVQAALLELELAEIITRHHGNRVSKLVTL